MPLLPPRLPKPLSRGQKARKAKPQPSQRQFLSRQQSPRQSRARNPRPNPKLPRNLLLNPRQKRRRSPHPNQSRNQSQKRSASVAPAAVVAVSRRGSN